MEKSNLEQQFLELCTNVVHEQGLELYDLELLTGQNLLRLYIQDRQSKTAVLEDCVKIDRALTEPFETLDWIPEVIGLEVSSPGIYRHLKEKKHFESACGEQVKVVLNRKLEDEQLPKKYNKKNTFIGTLEAVSDEGISLNVEGHTLLIDPESIKKANVDPIL